MIRNTGTASAGGYRPPVGRTPSAAAPLGLCLSSLTPTDMRYIYIYIYIYIYVVYIYMGSSLTIPWYSCSEMVTHEIRRQ